MQKMKMRTAAFLAATFAAILGPVSGAAAQSYPSRPITIIVPFPPGGQVDTLARILLDKMRAALGQTIIIENVGGASGGIGTTRVVRATPDGYTLNMGNWTSHVGGPAIYPVQFDILKDLEPVAMLPSAPTIIVARQNMPANNLNELVAWLKANPDKATAATVGAGSPGHVSGLFFQSETGTRMQFVPYRGGGPANQDLLAGQVDMRIGAEASQMLPHVRGGRVKAYAVMAKNRWAAAPDIPTIDEGGRARRPHFGVDRDLGAQRHAEGCRRTAQRGDDRSSGRRSGAQAHRRDRVGNSGARSADAGGAGSLSQGRDRQVVADHQSGEHQGGITVTRGIVRRG
jgi:tripartite-type tricarboxylate transporter receptor subunit TctC